MSTTISAALRCTVRNYPGALDWLHDRMIEAALAPYAALCRAVPASRVARVAGRNRRAGEGGALHQGTECRIRQEMVHEALVRARAAGGAGGADPELECGLNVWIHSGWAYFIPWGGPDWRRAIYGAYEPSRAHGPAPAAWPDGLEDFHFQDQTDRPAGMPSAAWRRRRRTWHDVVFSAGFDRRRLVHTVVEVSATGLLELAARHEQSVVGDAYWIARGLSVPKPGDGGTGAGGGGRRRKCRA